MYHYPIYNLVTKTDLARDPNFGAREGFEQDIRVGTSAKNSHTLANITVERYPEDDGSVNFTLFVDGIPCKSGVLRGKDFDQWYRHEFEEHSQQSREDEYQETKYA